MLLTLGACNNRHSSGAVVQCRDGTAAVVQWTAPCVFVDGSI